MSSSLTSNSVVFATAMAVSGTVILLALRLQKSQTPSIPRSCISSDGKKRDKKKKRVHFAEDVVDPSGNSEKFRRLRSNNANSKKSAAASSSSQLKKLPANRIALYNGILRDRVSNRVGYSY